MPVYEQKFTVLYQADDKKAALRKGTWVHRLLMRKLVGIELVKKGPPRETGLPEGLWSELRACPWR